MTNLPIPGWPILGWPISGRPILRGPISGRAWKPSFIVLFAAFLLIGADASARSTASIEAVDIDTLRVCADGSNMPFSNRKGEGFENDIAQLLAEWLGVDLSYEWFPQVIGYVRNTLGKKHCDVIIGITAGHELVLNTNPYWRWGHAIVYLKDAGIKVDRPDHPQLADLRIGAVAGTPTNNLLARNNLLAKVRPYRLHFDTRHENIGERMMRDLKNGLVDVLFISAPIAQYYGAQENLDLVMVPIETTDQGYGKMDFLMTMGVRQGESDWKRRLNTFLREKKDDIEAIFEKHNVPVLPLKPRRSKRKSSS